MPGFANRAALTPAELEFHHVREGLDGRCLAKALVPGGQNVRFHNTGRTGRKCSVHIYKYLGLLALQIDKGFLTN